MTIGIDIVEIQRIERLITRYQRKFLDKVFTPKEQQYCDQASNRYARYAGRFAAKEAIRKALQPMTSEEYLPFLDMEILPNDMGMPVPVLHTELQVQNLVSKISLSISHEQHYAVACAMAEE